MGMRPHPPGRVPRALCTPGNFLDRAPHGHQQSGCAGRRPLRRAVGPTPPPPGSRWDGRGRGPSAQPLWPRWCQGRAAPCCTCRTIPSYRPATQKRGISPGCPQPSSLLARNTGGSPTRLTGRRADGGHPGARSEPGRCRALSSPSHQTFSGGVWVPRAIGQLRAPGAPCGNPGPAPGSGLPGLGEPGPCWFCSVCRSRRSSGRRRLSPPSPRRLRRTAGRGEQEGEVGGERGKTDG